LLSLSPDRTDEGGLIAESGRVNAAYDDMALPTPLRLGVLSKSSSVDVIGVFEADGGIEKLALPIATSTMPVSAIRLFRPALEEPEDEDRSECEVDRCFSGGGRVSVSLDGSNGAAGVEVLRSACDLAPLSRLSVRDREGMSSTHKVPPNPGP
jgi:hypothetical protein